MEEGTRDEEGRRKEKERKEGRNVGRAKVGETDDVIGHFLMVDTPRQGGVCEQTERFFWSNSLVSGSCSAQSGSKVPGTYFV